MSTKSLLWVTTSRAKPLLINREMHATVHQVCMHSMPSLRVGICTRAAVTSGPLFASADEVLYVAKVGDRDTFKEMECNVINRAQRPSRRRSDASSRNEVGASSRDSCAPG